MDIINSVAYHYFEKEDGPLACLCSIPYEQAISISHKKYHTHDDRIYYLKQRMMFEELMLKSFIKKGGDPQKRYAYYFTINEKGFLETYFKNPDYLIVPVSCFDPKTISFTYGDSFYTYTRKDSHPTSRKVYTLNEIIEIIELYGTEFPDDQWYGFIEMQVWDDQTIRSYVSGL
ncbi:hypothetical protein FACS1894105_06960 [Clostridia bacterium]|nr:hypothetical protein FACS1894105_06960 [Clostridia bacterium]